MLKNKHILLFAFVLFVISNIISGVVSGSIVYYFTKKDCDVQKNNIPIIVKPNFKQIDFNKSKEDPLKLFNYLDI